MRADGFDFAIGKLRQDAITFPWRLDWVDRLGRARIMLGRTSRCR